MGRLNNSEFLAQLGDLLTAVDGQSSVYVTQKRLSAALPLENSDEIADLPSQVVASAVDNTSSYPVLIRVSTNANHKPKSKKKLSTVVETAQLDSFWADYASVIKSGFVGLKKKDKKKPKKARVAK